MPYAYHDTIPHKFLVVMTSALHAEGREFNPRSEHFLCKCVVKVFCVSVRVAQWIARLPPKEKAAGSNPASGTQFFFSVFTKVKNENSKRLQATEILWRRYGQVARQPLRKR